MVNAGSRELSAPCARQGKLGELLTFDPSDEALVESIRRGQPEGPERLYGRYHERLRRVLLRVLGLDQDLPDLLHEVFARALAQIDSLEHADRLGPWLTSIAVFTARGCIRRRKRQRWLSFWAPESLPEVVAVAPSDEAEAAMRSTYAVLERLPTEERIVFALRYLESMELREIGAACAISLATVKRRLARAEARFNQLAAQDPVLREWMEAVEEP
jgi:RNA polymerase sigma-70 factor (ECF subfamily)